MGDLRPFFFAKLRGKNPIKKYGVYCKKKPNLFGANNYLPLIGKNVERAGSYKLIN